MTSVSTGLLLLPQPRSISYYDGVLALQASKLIVIPDPTYLFTAQRLQTALLKIGLHWEIVVESTVLPADQIGVSLRQSASGRGYHLDIRPDGIHIVGANSEAIWHAVCTLNQIIASARQTLPLLSVADWPDFARRGVMLDISRDKVPTMQTLYALIDRLANWKINEIQLYTEHTFAYRRHPAVWAKASPLTGEDILLLDQFCRDRFIDLVPNQNSFGHMHRWLMHDEYRHLAEVPQGVDLAFMLSRQPFSLAVDDPGSLRLIGQLYEELLPNFTSQYFNVGCDETFDLGKGRSRERVEAQGRGRVYVDFVKQIAVLVKQHHRKMMFWGDIIMDHPDYVKELPAGLIALEWGYEADHPFDRDGARFAAAGMPFYVCPGTSSWLSLIGRTDNAIANLQNAAINGLKHGAIGYLITDWGDFGHWQPLPTSYLGFAYGAGLAWAADANMEMDIPAVLDRFAFEDPHRIMGQVAFDLGLCYRVMSNYPHNNGVAMVRALLNPLETIRSKAWLPDAKGDLRPFPINTSQVRAAIDCIEQTGQRLSEANPADPLVVPEYWLAIGLWRHGCERLLLAAGEPSTPIPEMALRLRSLMGDYRVRWLARNRPGGLSDSMVRMDRLLAEYDQLQAHMDSTGA